LHYLTSIFLTLLFFLTGEDFAVAKNQVSSAPLGDFCNLAVDQEFLTTDCTEYTDKSDLDRQGTTNAKVFNTSLESLFRDSIGVHSFLISASLGDLCALPVNLSSSRLSTDTYDANGNTLVSQEGGTGVSPVSSSSVTDVYSFDNKLIRRTTADGKVIDLTYTPDGHRLSKFITQNGLTQRLVHYLTDANNPTGYAQVIEEKQPLDTASPLKKVNLYGHDLISTEERGTGVSPVSSIYYAYDGLGSVRSISNATGDLTETYDYDAYGTLIGLAKRNPTTGLLESSNLSSTIPNPQSEFLYTGEQWDADLGMYFLRARYLNTNTGRFHSQDSYEGDQESPLSLHKYVYANGNPAMFTDPSGHYSLAEATAVIGQLSEIASIGFRVINVIDKVNSVIDFVNMAVGIVGLVNSGELYGAFDSAKNMLLKNKISFSGIQESFNNNWGRILNTGKANWIAGLAKAIVKGNKLSAFVIYLPNVGGLGATNLRTDLKIGKYRVILSAGGPSGSGGRVFGLGLALGKDGAGYNRGNPLVQLFRMDLGILNPVHPKPNIELDAWADSPYHYHVLKWQ
jgi:RHS repeat-associated protein